MIFVDTGAWFARYVPSDPNHPKVRSWLDANTEPLVTSDYCVDETLTLLMERGRVARAVEAGYALIEAKLARLQFISPDQFHRAWILFQQHAADGWSFTDCTSKIVIDDLDIRTAVALDDHFRGFGKLDVVP